MDYDSYLTPNQSPKNIVAIYIAFWATFQKDGHIWAISGFTIQPNTKQSVNQLISRKWCGELAPWSCNFFAKPET